jgi:hypothetical protein
LRVGTLDEQAARLQHLTLCHDDVLPQVSQLPDDLY